MVAKCQCEHLMERVHLGELDVQGPFAKFMDAPHYSESEPCGGAVTVSFSKYLFLGK
jgi:hypothetical protein